MKEETADTDTDTDTVVPGYPSKPPSTPPPPPNQRSQSKVPNAHAWRGGLCAMHMHYASMHHH